MIKHTNNRHNPNVFAQQLRNNPQATVNQTFFNKNWSSSQINSAIQRGQDLALSQGKTSGTFTFTYRGESVTVYMRNGLARSAWGHHTYTPQQLLNLGQ